MRIPRYDIFAGMPGSSDAIWKETASDLRTASERMKELAAKEPGPCFIYDALGRGVVAWTGNPPVRESEDREAAG